MAIPTLWEETIVLEPSHPGKLAAIARFDGNQWFVGVMNGEKTGKDISIGLSFLGNKTYDVLMAGDDEQGDPVNFNRTEKQGVTGTGKLSFRLSPGGGYVAWFRPAR